MTFMLGRSVKKRPVGLVRRIANTDGAGKLFQTTPSAKSGRPRIEVDEAVYKRSLVKVVFVAAEGVTKRALPRVPSNLRVVRQEGTLLMYGKREE